MRELALPITLDPGGDGYPEVILTEAYEDAVYIRVGTHESVHVSLVALAELLHLLGGHVPDEIEWALNEDGDPVLLVADDA